MNEKWQHRFTETNGIRMHEEVNRLILEFLSDLKK